MDKNLSAVGCTYIDKKYVMRLPELNCLTPKMHSTFSKLVEEVAECDEAIYEIRKYEKSNVSELIAPPVPNNTGNIGTLLITEEYKNLIYDALGEIMDIAQTCASQLFLFENDGVDIDAYFQEYVGASETQTLFTKNSIFRCIHFSPTETTISFSDTMHTIIVAMGRIAKLSKFIGNSGEVPILKKEEADTSYVNTLFKIIQECFNLLYGMEGKYGINLQVLFTQHVEKLVKKGYCKVA